MYSVDYNPYENFYYKDNKGFHYIGGRKSLAFFLAKGFRIDRNCTSTRWIYNIYCHSADILNPYAPEGIKVTNSNSFILTATPLSPIEFYDAAMRQIQPIWYIVEAFQLYLKWFENEKNRLYTRTLPTRVFKFRQGPVEGIHKYKHHRWYRSFHTGKQSQIMRTDPTFLEECGPERKGAMYYNSWVNERYACVGRCWKRNKKCKHQWEKNLSSKKKDKDK